MTMAAKTAMATATAVCGAIVVFGWLDLLVAVIPVKHEFWF